MSIFSGCDGVFHFRCAAKINDDTHVCRQCNEPVEIGVSLQAASRAKRREQIDPRDDAELDVNVEFK